MGMIVPFISLVRSLNCITNWPMFTPCWPRAGPTGGAGVACPPGHWSFTFAVITLAIVRPPFEDRRSQMLDLGSLSVRDRGLGIGNLDAFHLPVFEIHRRRPVEDDQHHLDEA